MPLTRRKPPPEPTPEFTGMVKATQVYAEGLADGVELTLCLLLGEPAGGGVPFEGELPADVRRWAEQALSFLPESKAGLARIADEARAGL